MAAGCRHAVADLDASSGRQASDRRLPGTPGQDGKPGLTHRHRLNLTRASSYEDATDAGEAVGQFLELGSVPSRALAQAMYKRMSILVLMVDARPASPAPLPVRNLGAVLVNRTEIPGRRSYDLAHELFHILTWDAMPPERLDDGEGSGKLQKRVETMAEKFAFGPPHAFAVIQGMAGDATDPGWLNATATGLGVSAKRSSGAWSTLGGSTAGRRAPTTTTFSSTTAAWSPRTGRFR